MSQPSPMRCACPTRRPATSTSEFVGPGTPVGSSPGPGQEPPSRLDVDPASRAARRPPPRTRRPGARSTCRPARRRRSRVRRRGPGSCRRSRPAPRRSAAARPSPPRARRPARPRPGGPRGVSTGGRSSTTVDLDPTRAGSASAGGHATDLARPALRGRRRARCGRRGRARRVPG